MKNHKPIPLEDIKTASKRISEVITRTPLVRLNYDEDAVEIYLKLENLQPMKSFKIRPAYSIIQAFNEEQLKNGVWTISAGNLAQGLAWSARKRGISCTIVVSDQISQIKEKAILNLGANLIKMPYETRLMKAGLTEKFEGTPFEEIEGKFIHPFSNQDVMAGNGTIGLEIIEDLPEVDTVLIPRGGGGLACGIASAIRALKPDVKIYATEVDFCTPLASTFETGMIPDEFPHTHSFVDAIGHPFMLPEMLNLAKEVLDGVLVTSLEQTSNAIQLLAERNGTIAEGAGAVPVAVALSGKAGKGKIACVVSGGNINKSKFIEILQQKEV